MTDDPSPVKKRSVAGSQLSGPRSNSESRIQPRKINDTPVPMSAKIKAVIKSCRPWTLPISIMPTLVVASLLNKRHNIVVELPALSALAAAFVAFQAAGNLHNLHTDFVTGLDKAETAKDRSLVDKIVKPETVLGFAGAFASIFIIFLAYALNENYNQNLLIVGVLGTVCGYKYSGFPYPFKYLALGDVCIFACWNLLIAFQSLYWSNDIIIELFIILLPISCHTVAILHSNNLRDIENDVQSGARTVASVIGYTKGQVYYEFLALIIPYVGCIVASLYSGCGGVLFQLCSFPLSIVLAREARGTAQELYYLTKNTAMTHTVIGTTILIGVWSTPQKEVDVQALAATLALNALVFLKRFLDKRNDAVNEYY